MASRSQPLNLPEQEASTPLIASAIRHSNQSSDGRNGSPPNAAAAYHIQTDLHEGDIVLNHDRQTIEDQSNEDFNERPRLINPQTLINRLASVLGNCLAGLTLNIDHNNNNENSDETQNSNLDRTHYRIDASNNDVIQQLLIEANDETQMNIILNECETTKKLENNSIQKNWLIVKNVPKIRVFSMINKIFY